MRNASVKRISGYGVAVAAVLSSTSSKGSVVFFDVNPDATGSNSANGSVLLSFSLTGVVATDGSHVVNEQFNATHTYGAATSTFPTSSKLTFHANGTAAFNPYPLAYGTTIGPGQSIDPTATGSNLTGFFETPKGHWSNGQEAYLALKFDNSGTPNYGWADITVNSPASITLHSFAYDDAGNPVAAGSINPVPEPTQIALFALGATGLVAYRRRKQAIVAAK